MKCWVSRPTSVPVSFASAQHTPKMWAGREREGGPQRRRMIKRMCLVHCFICGSDVLPLTNTHTHTRHTHTYTQTRHTHTNTHTHTLIQTHTHTFTHTYTLCALPFSHSTTSLLPAFRMGNGVDAGMLGVVIAKKRGDTQDIT